MKKVKLVLLIASSFILCSCAPPQPVQQYNAPVARTLPNKILEPGEYPMDSPEAVWNQYNCGTRELPLVVLEDNSLNPSSVYAGQQINHLLIYAVCSRSSNETFQGTINWKLYSIRGKFIIQFRKKVELKPGRWSIVRRIDISPKAKPGTYELRTEFFSKKGVKLRTLSANFEVSR